MSVKVDLLSQHLQKHLGDHIVAQSIALGEITVDVDVAVYMDTMLKLRDEPELRF